MTKMYAPEVFGRFALALSIVSLVSAVCTFNLRAVMVSDPDEKTSLASYFYLTIITSVLALAISISIGTFSHFSKQLFLMILFLGLGQGVVYLKEITLGVMQRNERMDLAAISRMLQGILSLASAVLLSLLIRDAVLIAVGMLIGRLLVWIFFDIPRSSALAVKKGPASLLVPFINSFKAIEITALARLAFPLGIVALLISFQANIPRYFLAGSFGEKALGFFAAVATFMSMEEIVISALGQSAAHRLAFDYAHNQRSFRKLLGKLASIGFGLGLVGLLASLAFGKELIRIFFREEYGSYAHVFVWLMVARVALNVFSFLGYGMTAARKFRVQILVSGLMAGSLCLASWILIPRYAGLGAAWSILCSACVGIFLAVLVLKGEIFAPKDSCP
jgi:O-antigen/teichoic acid export membrane protein